MQLESFHTFTFTSDNSRRLLAVTLKTVAVEDSFVLFVGVFRVVEEFIDNLQRAAGKRFIITAQSYDGASSMRYQAQGHIRSRLSVWAMYVYCRSHLLNLSVKDAIEWSFYDAYDTIKSALVFLRDSPHRMEVLFNSQKAIGSSREGTRYLTYSLVFFYLTTHLH